MTVKIFTQLTTSHRNPNCSLTLPFEKRQRSRQKIQLDNGDEAGLALPRGTVLKDGDQIIDDEGFVVEINSSKEAVSTVYSEISQSLARAAYHLGNRHVNLQIGTNWLRYQQDHVLDDMVRKLGLEVIVEKAKFDPELGAYHAHSHSE